MDKLTLENLQSWIDEVSPIKIDLSNQPYTIISEIDSGIAGGVRTLLHRNDPFEVAGLTTANLSWDNAGEVDKVKIQFTYIKHTNKITEAYIKESKWFLPNDRL